MASTVADVMVATLKASGVRCVYGIPGDSLNGFTDALRRDGDLAWEQGHVRDRDAREQPVVDHALGAVTSLLGGLEQRDHRPGPLARVISQQLGRTEQAGQVHVVAAGVGDGHCAAVRPRGGDGARVVHAGVLADGSSASSSARSRTAGPLPLARTPTTPVPPMPVWTLKP